MGVLTPFELDLPTELCRLTHGFETGDDLMEKRQMNLRYLVLALATLTSISLAGSSFALPISIFPAEEITNSTLLKPIHGCHPYYEWGWVRRWDTEARHRHSQRYDCEPRGGGGGGDWDRRGERGDGPPRGWRQDEYRRGCMKVGPVWYCPPE